MRKKILLLLLLFTIGLGVLIIGASNFQHSEIFRPLSKSNNSHLDEIIYQQIDEANLRKNNPPTNQEIEIMRNSKTACFHNDDCRRSSGYLPTTCNNLIANKYYCQHNGCSVTQVGCMTAELVSDICVDNICTQEIIEEEWTMFPYSLPDQ